MFKSINSKNDVLNKDIFIFGDLMSGYSLLLFVKNSPGEGGHVKISNTKILFLSYYPMRKLK
jgi:hypothetical protein